MQKTLFKGSSYKMPKVKIIFWSIYTLSIRWPTRVNAIKNGFLQTKKIGCKQKGSDANKKDRMQTKKIGCKQKRSDANKKPKPVTMQTKKDLQTKKKME